MNYEIIKSKRSKYSRVRIKSNGMVVITVPYYMNSTEIDKVYLKFLPWINKHMDKAIDKSLESEIKDNGYIYILGNKTTIHVFNDSKNYVELSDSLNIYLNQKKTIEKVLDDFIKEYSKEVFESIINKYLLITGFTLNSLKIKRMKSAYGRCNKDKKEIALSIYNIHKRIEFNEAVIVHELCHLKECNHKKAFYDLVYKYYPNYKEEIKRKVN